MAEDQSETIQELTDKVRRLESTQEVLVKRLSGLAKTLSDIMQPPAGVRSVGRTEEEDHFVKKTRDRTYRTRCDEVIKALKDL